MIISAIQQTLLVTGFVLSMMMLIEYVNILTHGSWMNKLKEKPIRQILLGTILGLTPGCFGTFTVVSLYTHRMLSFGALVAALIATSGDETFMMLALIPKEAMIIVFGVAIIGFLAGILVDKLIKPNAIKTRNDKGFTYHPAHEHCSTHGKIHLSFAHITFSWKRISCVLLFVFFAVAPFIGLVVHEHECIPGLPHHHHHHGIDWVGIMFSFFAICSALIALLSSEHFVKEHIWHHLVEKHLLKIFLWTFATVLLIILMRQYSDVDAWIGGNLYVVLLIAVLVGIIPQSGPHLIFLSLYISGAIPLSILFANSIVQDGHGALPLFAESKKAFFWAKLINIIVGLLVGGIGLAVGL